MYEIIADMSFKINELNEKVKKLENEQTPKKQMQIIGLFVLKSLDMIL